MKTFKRGGVHPPEYKELAENKAIETFQVPELLYIPVSQHIGAFAGLKVKVGDKVEKGQIIAEAAGYVSTNIHATVSGTVKKIEKIQNILGIMVDHVIIENDKKEEWAAGLNQPQKWEELSVDELLDKILDSGIVGMGGATFPTHVKLKPPPGKKIDALVINGAECEPYLTCDHRLMLEKADGVATGIKIIQKILGVKKVIVGIESNKKDAFNKIRAVFAGDPEVQVELLKVKYPQGAEKQLIDSVLGREVPSGGLPMEVGVVVQNIATCFAIFEAVTMNKPLIERVVTVSGDGVEVPANYLVRIGTPMSALLQKSRIKKKVQKIISGGPMMGVAMFNPELPVLKGTSGIVVLSKIPDFLPRECIRCGKCLQVCPVGLQPTELMKAVKYKLFEDYEKFHITDCIECGSCAFICPARIPLVQYMKEGKLEIAEMKKREREIEEVKARAKESKEKEKKEKKEKS